MRFLSYTCWPFWSFKLLLSLTVLLLNPFVYQQRSLCFIRIRSSAKIWQCTSARGILSDWICNTGASNELYMIWSCQIIFSLSSLRTMSSTASDSRCVVDLLSRSLRFVAQRMHCELTICSWMRCCFFTSTWPFSGCLRVETVLRTSFWTNTCKRLSNLGTRWKIREWKVWQFAEWNNILKLIDNFTENRFISTL